MFEKIILVTRKTRYEDLIERFNTRAQAKFYIEHSGSNFEEYEKEYEIYQKALSTVHSAINSILKIHAVDRTLVPSLLINDKDIIVTLGQDGLVANTAKYAGQQPIIAVNPDPERFDGVLLPFLPQQLPGVVDSVMQGKAVFHPVTMAEVTLEDGQKLRAFNDFFIGAATHVSARYKIYYSGKHEVQSSSGVIVSTGAGSTGWLSSVFNMAGGLTKAFGGNPPEAIRLPWEDRRLVFAVREPFKSKHSSVGLIAGLIENGKELIVESLIPYGGVIFSDGVEKDYLSFGSGSKANIRSAESQAQLVIEGKNS